MTDDLNALYINSIVQCAVLKPLVLAHFFSLKCTAHQKPRCCHLIKQLPVCSQTNFLWERRDCQSLLCWACTILTGSDKVRASKPNINSTHILHSHSNPGWLKSSWQDVEAAAKVLLRENIPSWRIARKMTRLNGTHFVYKANLSNDFHLKPWIKNVFKFELVIHRKVEVHLKKQTSAKVMPVLATLRRLTYLLISWFESSLESWSKKLFLGPCVTHAPTWIRLHFCRRTNKQTNNKTC